MGVAKNTYENNFALQRHARHNFDNEIFASIRSFKNCEKLYEPSEILKKISQCKDPTRYWQRTCTCSSRDFTTTLLCLFSVFYTKQIPKLSNIYVSYLQNIQINVIRNLLNMYNYTILLNIIFLAISLTNS